MTTKEQVEQCIKSLEWLKFNIVGTEELKKNTFEYATKVYLENAIALLKDSIEYTDIEKELGIDLVTLFKAIKNGFYAKDESGDIFFISSDMMKKQYEDSIKKLKDFNNDYGKIWALTRNELIGGTSK